MFPPIIEENPAWATSLVGGMLFGIYKAVMRIRKDQRADGEESQIYAARKDNIEFMRAEIKRLSTSLETLSRKLDDEIAAKYAAETKAFVLSRRVSVLEIELDELRRGKAIDNNG